MNSLKRGDNERRARTDFLTEEIIFYDRKINKVLRAIEADDTLCSDRDVHELEYLEHNRDKVQDELEYLCLQAKDGDMLDGDFVARFRADDIDINEL